MLAETYIQNTFQPANKCSRPLARRYRPSWKSISEQNDTRRAGDGVDQVLQVEQLANDKKANIPPPKSAHFLPHALARFPPRPPSRPPPTQLPSPSEKRKRQRSGNVLQVSGCHRQIRQSALVSESLDPTRRRRRCPRCCRAIKTCFFTVAAKLFASPAWEKSSTSSPHSPALRHASAPPRRSSPLSSARQV